MSGPRGGPPRSIYGRGTLGSGTFPTDGSWSLISGINWETTPSSDPGAIFDSSGVTLQYYSFIYMSIRMATTTGDTSITIGYNYDGGSITTMGANPTTLNIGGAYTQVFGVTRLNPSRYVQFHVWTANSRSIQKDRCCLEIFIDPGS